MLLYPLDEMAVPGVRVGGRPGELGDERAEQVGDAAGQPIADGGRVGVRAGGEGVEEGQQDGSSPSAEVTAVPATCRMSCSATPSSLRGTWSRWVLKRSG